MLRSPNLEKGRELRGRGNLEFLSDGDVIRILQLVLVSVENPHVFLGVSVELLADLRQRISLFYRIAPIGCRQGCIHREIRRDVVEPGINSLDSSRRIYSPPPSMGAAPLMKQLAILLMQVGDLYAL